MSRWIARAVLPVAAALAAALLAVPAAGPAAADAPYYPAPGSTVTLSTSSDNVLHMAYRRTDGSVAILDAGGWWPGGGGSTSLGGAVSTSPAVLTTGYGVDANDWVFAAGTNGAVYYRKSTTNPVNKIVSWSPWASLGSSTTSTPAATCTTAGESPWVFIRGSDGALWQRSFDTPWTRAGGAITSAPATVTPSVGSCPSPTKDVVALGTDKAVWEWRYGVWTRIGGSSAHAPAITRHDGVTYVFVVGTNGALYVASRATASSPWSAFSKIGGAFSSAPAATVWSEYPYTESGLTVVALGTNDKIYRATRSLSGSEPWAIEPGRP